MTLVTQSLYVDYSSNFKKVCDDTYDKIFFDEIFKIRLHEYVILKTFGSTPYN